MKVNFILPGLGDSGGIRVVKKYAQMLNDKEIDTVIYCSILTDNLHRYRSRVLNLAHQLYCTIKTITTMSNNSGVKWVPFICDSFIRKADHSIATMWTTAYKVNRLSEKCGKKWYFVQDFEIWDSREYGLKSYKLPLSKIVISTWINEQLKKELGLGPFPVVYNGLDTSAFNAQKRTKHEGITFLMLNHSLEKKGVKQGLEVYRKIHERHPNTKMRAFGMCSKDNLPSDVEYFQNPDKETLLSLYRDTDIFIFPSLSEGCGLTPLEAMACGCIVVVK